MTATFFYSQKQTQEPMFQLTLKIEGQILTLPVHQTDNKSTLIAKLLANKNCKVKDEQKLYGLIKGKLFDSLLNIANSDKLNETLKQKVHRFIHEGIKKDIKQIEMQRTKENQENVHSKTNSKGFKSSSKKLNQSYQKSILKNKSVNRTPYNKLFSKNKKPEKSSSEFQQSFPRAVSPQNRHKNAKCSEFSHQKLNQNPSADKRVGKEQQKMLQKAYQIILRSAKDQGMKKMALKCLESMTQKSSKKNPKFNYNERIVDEQNSKGFKPEQKSSNLNYIYTSEFGRQSDVKNKTLDFQKLRNKSLGAGTQRRYNYQQFFNEQEVAQKSQNQNKGHQLLKREQRQRQTKNVQGIREDYNSLQRRQKIRNRTARSYERIPAYLKQDIQRKPISDYQKLKLPNQSSINNFKSPIDSQSLSFTLNRANLSLLMNTQNLLVSQHHPKRNNHLAGYAYNKQSKNNKSCDAIFRGRRFKYEI